MKNIKAIISLSLFFAHLLVYAQDDDKWDINNPVAPFKETTIETDEGTWMNLDVSPDGQTIVFDMLGDIYSLPITGGEARMLREGHAFEVEITDYHKK